ncbi:MAG: SCO family protein [Verrucomicrobiota bacterium]|nr:SCO family protein [Verrucomicrobiota bacterium]
MDSRSNAYRKLFRSGLVLVLLFVGYGLFLINRSGSGGSGAPSTVPLPVLRTISSMELVDQEGEPVNLQTFRGQPWFANIIFTRCPGPCARMTQKMRQLQEALPAEASEVQLVSLTTDPDFDTPEVLSQYARKFQADTRSWKFLTGTKEEIVRVSTQEWLLVMLEKGEAERESPNDIFLHSTLTVLMDGLGRIRGTYEILEEGQLEEALADLQRLLQEAS